MNALLPLATWVPILDGDDHACAMFERHYSAAKSLRLRRERGTRLFGGPGFKLILSTPCRRALFVWRQFRSADDIADRRWPGERHYTYVNPRAVLSSNPGYCFIRAGWWRCGTTKTRKLIILERAPS